MKSLEDFSEIFSVEGVNLIKNLSKGFTLLELLIVIALLGALFIGLLATLDPLEQIKKGSDTSRRNMAAEIYGAAINYYAVKTNYPWSVDITAMAASDTAMTSATGYLTQIVNSGELKSDFISLAGVNLGRIFLTSTADASGARQKVAICFKPDSRSFAQDINAKYDGSGEVTTGCLSMTSTGTACYFCIK